MSQVTISPGSVDLAAVDELISISMNSTSIIVAPTSRPDALGTQVVVDVVNAAGVAGATVVMQRPDALESGDVLDASVLDIAGSDESVAAATVGVGLVSVRSEAAIWTIDLGSARFVRTDAPVDRLALSASRWTAFERVWIAPHFVSALTRDGSYVTGRRMSSPPCDVLADKRSTCPLSHIA